MTVNADDLRVEEAPNPGKPETRWPRLNPYLLLALASLFWSGNHILGRAMSGHVPPIGISTVRWLVPALLLWPLARRHLEHDWAAIRANWLILLWLGITGGALFTVLQYVGLQYTSALNVSVLNSLVPVLIVAAGAVLFRDRILAVQLAGIVISSLGVLTIISRGRVETLMDLRFNVGDVLIVVNMAVFSIYAACLRLRPQVHWLSFIFVLAVISAATTVPLRQLASVPTVSLAHGRCLAYREQALPPGASLTTAQRVRRLPLDRPEAGVAVFADHDVDMHHDVRRTMAIIGRSPIDPLARYTGQQVIFL
jgi:drug/metabolite transporter (DMT)-like permease